MSRFAGSDFQEALAASIRYLESDEALLCIRRDPYWPKWDTPWWHMLLLHEMGMANRIPAVALNEMVQVLKGHYLPLFPVYEDELPPGTDPYRQVACHCALGSIYQVLFAAGLDVDAELAWLRPWFLRYQLPDGGLNCDEAAYRKDVRKSSIVSTLPPLEAVLFCTPRPFTKDELSFLDRGAQYLLDQRLFRKKSDGEVIDPSWLEAKFPRYYEYDYLRGFYFLTKWARVRSRQLPGSLVTEVHELVNRQMTPQGIELKRFHGVDNRSYTPLSADQWQWMETSSYPALHKLVSARGHINPWLTQQWEEVRP